MEKQGVKEKEYKSDILIKYLYYRFCDFENEDTTKDSLKESENCKQILKTELNEHILQIINFFLCHANTNFNNQIEDMKIFIKIKTCFDKAEKDIIYTYYDFKNTYENMDLKFEKFIN